MYLVIQLSSALSERRNFFAKRINGFLRSEPGRGLVRVTLKQNKADQSIYPSEVIRARGFADSLSQKAEGRNFDVPAEVLEKETKVDD